MDLDSRLLAASCSLTAGAFVGTDPTKARITSVSPVIHSARRTKIAVQIPS
jgi:hypothetical protein